MSALKNAPVFHSKRSLTHSVSPLKSTATHSGQSSRADWHSGLAWSFRSFRPLRSDSFIPARSAVCFCRHIRQSCRFHPITVSAMHPKTPCGRERPPHPPNAWPQPCPTTSITRKPGTWRQDNRSHSPAFIRYAALASIPLHARRKASMPNKVGAEKRAGSLLKSKNSLFRTAAIMSILSPLL